MFNYLLPRKDNNPEGFQAEIPDEVFIALEFIKFCVDKSGLCWSKSGDGPYEMEMHPAQDQAFRDACGVLSRYFGQYEENHDEDVPGEDDL